MRAEARLEAADAVALAVPGVACDGGCEAYPVPRGSRGGRAGQAAEAAGEAQHAITLCRAPGGLHREAPQGERSALFV